MDGGRDESSFLPHSPNHEDLRKLCLDCNPVEGTRGNNRENKKGSPKEPHFNLLTIRAKDLVRGAFLPFYGGKQYA